MNYTEHAADERFLTTRMDIIAIKKGGGGRGLSEPSECSRGYGARITSEPISCAAAHVRAILVPRCGSETVLSSIQAVNYFTFLKSNVFFRRKISTRCDTAEDKRFGVNETPENLECLNSEECPQRRKRVVDCKHTRPSYAIPSEVFTPTVIAQSEWRKPLELRPTSASFLKLGGLHNCLRW